MSTSKSGLKRCVIKKISKQAHAARHMVVGRDSKCPPAMSGPLYARDINFLAGCFHLYKRWNKKKINIITAQIFILSSFMNMKKNKNERNIIFAFHL